MLFFRYFIVFFLSNELKCLFIKLMIPLQHELLECSEIIYSSYLVYNLFVQRLFTCFLACLHELVLSNT